MHILLSFWLTISLCFLLHQDRWNLQSFLAKDIAFQNLFAWHESWNSQLQDLRLFTLRLVVSVTQPHTKYFSSILLFCDKISYGRSLNALFKIFFSVYLVHWPLACSAHSISFLTKPDTASILRVCLKVMNTLTGA